MKWTYPRLILAVSLSILATQSFAIQQVRTIYGVTNAQHFNTKQRAVFTIQLGSFSNQSNAMKLQNSLRSKTRLPVRLEQKNGRYAVMVGPLQTASDVRAAGRDLEKVQLNASKTRSVRVTKPRVKQPAHYQSVNVQTNPRQQVSYNQHRALSQAVANKSLSARLTPTQKNWYTSVGVGGQFPTLNSSMTINNGSGFPAPFDQDIYSTSNNAQVVLEASAGRRWHNDHLWLPALQIGVLYEYFLANNVGGTITQYSSPQFRNYNYGWNIASNVVLASAKLNLFQYKRLSPYFNGGIGGAFNRSSGYREMAAPGITARVSPDYAANTSNQFAYNAGAGIDFQFAPQLFLSVGYLYQDLGKVSSGQGTQTWAGQSLNLGTYRSNDVMASITYLFGQ